MLGHHDFLLSDVFLARKVLSLLVKDLEALHVVLVGVVANCPLALYDEVDFSHVTLLIQNVTVFRCRFKPSRHEAESDLVNEVRVEFTSNSEEITE